jgi:hypothetical protein
VRCWLTILGLLVALTAFADDASPPESPERHARTGVQTHATAAEGPVPTRDGPRDAALQAIETKLACVCYDAGQLRVDPSRSLRASECACPEAQTVRADLERSLAGLSTPQLADKRRVAETLEAVFVPLRAEYERVWRTPEADYAWFMDNVRCVCDGCKPTVFFSKCQLSCTPGILYKLRARVFLGLGFSRDELLDYYLAEINASRPAREQVTRAWLLPRLQRERGWLVPVLALAGALLLGFAAVRRWVRPATFAVQTPTTPAPQPEPVLSSAARARIRRALEEDDG